tara:strand:+ start:4247 stop:4747 length:501 start_codon:yes stop_codon:yes gene_type:complete
MIVTLSDDVLDLVAEITRRVPSYFSAAVQKDHTSRAMGFLGEAAAAIFLSGSDEPFRETWRRMVDQPDKPDLDRYPDIEIKTVPDMRRPHFAIGNGRRPEVKVTNYLVFRKISPRQIQVEGWLGKDDVMDSWKRSHQYRFPSGTPILPCSWLRSPESCPWRETDGG